MMSANAEIGVAVANFFPRIGLTALYGGESDKIGNVIKNNFSIWNIAGSVSGPIFQGGRLLEQYRARQAFWDETIAAYRGTIIQALREVSDALAAQSKLVEQRAAEERQVKALATAVELSLDPLPHRARELLRGARSASSSSIRPRMRSRSRSATSSSRSSTSTRRSAAAGTSPTTPGRRCDDDDDDCHDGAPPSRRDRRLRVRRTLRREAAAARRRRRHRDRPDEPPPVPAAALPARDGDPLRG